MDNKSVLVVVDVQNGFVRDKSKHVVSVIVDLVDRWQNAGGPVVFTRYLNHPGSQFERLIHWTALQDSPEIDIVDELQPYAKRATAVIDKTIYSLFTDEGAELVTRHGWTDIYVCGIATESCVLKTAVDAFERGLNPYLIEDASASHAGQAVHEAGVLVTLRFIGKDQIITTASLAFAPLRLGRCLVRNSDKRTIRNRGRRAAAKVCGTNATCTTTTKCGVHQCGRTRMG